jgi:hypothetical protein
LQSDVYEERDHCSHQRRQSKSRKPDHSYELS